MDSARELTDLVPCQQEKPSLCLLQVILPSSHCSALAWRDQPMAITDRFRAVNCAPLRVKSRAVPGFFCLPYGRQKGDSWPKFEWNGPIVDVLYSVQSDP